MLSRTITRSTQPFFDAYVFVVGGGTYTEYHNLLDWSRSTGSGGGGASSAGLAIPGSGHSLTDLTSAALAAGRSASSAVSSPAGASRRITYGGTEMLSPLNFLDQVCLYAEIFYKIVRKTIGQSSS